MTCPKCGGYSPYNTSVCNRCGARLTGEKALTQKRSRWYYRNAKKSAAQKGHDRFVVFFDELLGRIDADKRLKLAVMIAAAVIALGALSLMGWCTACTCRACICSGDVSGTEASDGDILPEIVSESDVSSGDISASDISSGDVSASDVSSSDRR